MQAIPTGGDAMEALAGQSEAAPQSDWYVPSAAKGKTLVAPQGALLSLNRANSHLQVPCAQAAWAQAG